MNLTPATDLTAFLDAHLTEQERARRRTPRHVHASGILNCQRQQTYALLGTPADSIKSDPKWTRAANMGDKTHEYIVGLFQAAGVLESAEQPIPYNDYGLSGRYDAVIVLNGERIVVDIKSMDSGKYQAYENSSKIRDAYAQIMCYLHILGLKTGYILAVNRDKLDWKEYRIDYNAEHARWLLDRAAAITMYVAEGIIPPIDVNKPADCFWCNFRARCDQDDARRNREVA